MRPPHRRILLPAVLAAIAVAAVAAVLSVRGNDPFRRLVAAHGERSRTVEPRLSGSFPWAPLEKGPATGDGERTSRAALLNAAAGIARRREGDDSSSTRRAVALAKILTGDARSAVAILEPLAEVADAPVLNDLAAAQYVVATREADPSRLQRALVAADSALRIDARSVEAHFNRALILEALGLRDLARDQWQTYLRLDPGSAWSAEARSHVRALAPEETFEEVVQRDHDRLTSDPAAATAFAHRYRQQARTWGESELLGNWASALRQNDPVAAAKHLRLARALGTALARDGGDRTLATLVEAIDRADATRRAALIEGHAHFRDGIRAHRDRRPRDARPLLLSAADEFARGRSPGVWRARYFAANGLFLQGNIAECGRQMRQLLDAIPPGFLGHRAEIRWVLASVAVSEGRWEDCIEAWTESLSIYERLGERNNAAVVRQQLVFTYDRLGNRTRAWKERMIALRELGREANVRQYEALVSVTRAAIMDEDWQAARSFVQLEVDVARRIELPVLQAESLLYQAEIHALLGEVAAAASHLAEARRKIARIPDPSFRATVEVRAHTVAASLTSDARSAVRLLTTAIEFHSSKGRRMYVPDLFLRRGRAWLRVPDSAQAAADFEAGIAELERHRESVARGENRWGVFHAAHELFGEAIALALSRGDAQTAFDYSERARARALFDTLGAPWRSVRAADLPPHTAILEYAIHGDTIFFFVLDERGVRALRRPVNRRRLSAEIAALTAAGAGADASRFERSARALYAQLLAPVEPELAGKRTLAIVPDPALGKLPFAALMDGAGRYLVETYAVTIEPSAAFFVNAGTPRAGETAPRILIVTGGEELGRLAAAEREARAIAALYRHPTLLQRDVATPGAFLREARKTELIHFAGHSVASTAAGGGYLALGRDGSADGRLDLNEISSAALPRTSVVVLAACDTAGGEIRSGEGTISVARAFLAAGVSSVVATLWPIEDEASAEFFPVLHQHLARGLPPKDALRAAQLEWIRRGRRSNSLWASVQVIGR